MKGNPSTAYILITHIPGLFFGLGLVLLTSFLFITDNPYKDQQIQANAKEIDPGRIDPQNNNKFISATGVLKTVKKIRDKQFMKKSARYLAIKRQVEMFSWTERKITHGRGRRATIDYKYEKKYTAHSPDSKKFRRPDGHYNPKKWLQSKFIPGKSIRMGAYKVSVKNLDINCYTQLELKRNELLLKRYKRSEILQNALFLPYVKNSSKAHLPEIGDIRIKFQVIESPKRGTLFGKIYKKSITFYQDTEKRVQFFRFFHNRDRKAVNILLKGVGKNKEDMSATLILLFLFFGFWIVIFCLQKLLIQFAIKMEVLKKITDLHTFIISIAFAFIIYYSLGGIKYILGFIL